MRVTNTGCSDPRGVAKSGNKKAQLITVGLWMVVEYSTLTHADPTENEVASAGARNKEESLTPFHKFALLRALPRHISAGNCGLGYRPDQGTRTGRTTRGLRAWLAVCRLAVRERIRRIAWSWWYARKASATEISMNVAVV